MRRHVLSTFIALAARFACRRRLSRRPPISCDREARSGRQGLDHAADSRWTSRICKACTRTPQTIPVARPANLGAKEFYTDEADRAEAAAQAAARRIRRARRFVAGGSPGRSRGRRPAVHYDNSQFGLRTASAKERPACGHQSLAAPKAGCRR